MQLTRNDFLFLFVGAVSGALLGCSAVSKTDDPDLQALTTEANAIATGFGTAVVTLGSAVSHDVQGELQTYLANIKADATTIAKSTSAVAAAIPVNRIATYVAGFASLVPALGLPAAVASTVTEIITAAQVLIPIMAQHAGLVGASPVAPVMSEQQAIAVLTRGA